LVFTVPTGMLLVVLMMMVALRFKFFS